MDGLRRVTFRFEDTTEVRYLPRIPEPGDLVVHERNLWLVAFVSPDAVGMTVICEFPERDGMRSRHVA
jgi:hypothetical protein